jgi:hypothetical protein
MSIEVKQMLVKATVISDPGAGPRGNGPERPADLAAIKSAILDECRQMIADILRDMQER